MSITTPTIKKFRRKNKFKNGNSSHYQLFIDSTIQLNLHHKINAINFNNAFAEKAYIPAGRMKEFDFSNMHEDPFLHKPLNIESNKHKYSKSMSNTKRTKNFYERMKKGIKIGQQKRDISPYLNHLEDQDVHVRADSRSSKIKEVKNIMDTTIDSQLLKRRLGFYHFLYCLFRLR